MMWFNHDKVIILREKVVIILTNNETSFGASAPQVSGLWKDCGRSCVLLKERTTRRKLPLSRRRKWPGILFFLFPLNIMTFGFTLVILWPPPHVKLRLNSRNIVTSFLKSPGKKPPQHCPNTPWYESSHHTLITTQHSMLCVNIKARSQPSDSLLHLPLRPNICSAVAFSVVHSVSAWFPLSFFCK